jgi:hypothetical protein
MSASARPAVWSAESARVARVVRHSALAGRPSSDDDAIRVTVGSSGRLESLDIGDRATGPRGEELSRLILAVMRKAQAALAAKVSAR